MAADEVGAGKGAGPAGVPVPLAVSLALLATLPVLLAQYPQMLDYPAHLARWGIMLDIGHDPDLARHYRFTWAWVPNLGADFAIVPLAGLFGLEPGGRVLVGLVAGLLALSFVATEWALRRRIGVGSLLALATVWSPTLLMGFLNFSLAEALAFLGFALWVVLENRRWRPLPFLMLGPVLWFCHLAGWGVLGVLLFGFEWHRRPGLAGTIRAGLATWPLWPPLGFLFAGSGGGAFSPQWPDGQVLRAKLFNWVVALRDQVTALDIATVALLALLPIVALRAGRADGRIGRAALILAVLTILVPRNLAGGDFADYRLVPVALAAGVLAIDGLVSARLLALAAVPFLVRLGFTTAAWERDSRETAAVLTALDAVPRGSVVAGAWGFVPAHWRASPMGHVFAYATVRRAALTNAHFAVPGLHALQLAQPDAGFVDPSQRLVLRPGERPDLAAFAPAAHAQYLWYYGEAEPLRLPPGATVIWRGPHSLLARLAFSHLPR